MPDTRSIVDWLVAGAPGAKNPAEVVARLGGDLVASGFPVDRIEAFVRTLHPHIAGRRFVWEPPQATSVSDCPYAYLQSPAFAAHPVGETCRTGDHVRRRLAPGDEGPLAPLAAGGFTDFYSAPMHFLNGEDHAVTFATRAAGGFADAHIEAIRALVPPLARVGEIYALSRTAVSLLNTYVGRGAGERILAGGIHRGSTETLRAVIWFSDLRGFTELAGAMEPAALIRLLDQLFECQVPAIERRGGEVLKFIGDGLLAIFPIADSGASPGSLCDASLEAASDAFAALGDLNDERTRRAEPAIHFGLALHVGEVSFGNIGGSARLDFTAIGPAVNVAARLEGLTARLGRRLVVSQAFAEATSRPTRALGSFTLKGVRDEQLVLEPI